MGTKIGPSYANLFVGFIEHQFFLINTTAPNLNFLVATLTTALALRLPYQREELTQFKTAINSFHPALKYTWEIFDTSLAFLDIKISI